MCSKSGERCNWTFYGSACKFLKGIVADFWCDHLVLLMCNSMGQIFGPKRKHLHFCSTEENLKSLASGLVVQQCSERSCVEGEGKTHMNLHLIRYSRHLSAAYMLLNLKAFSKMNVQSPMPRSLVMQKGMLLFL